MEEIKNLYKKTYEEKWKEIEELIDDNNIEQVMSLAFDYCPFCDEVINNGIVTLNSNGCDCKPVCKVDPIICGAKGSLIERLSLSGLRKERCKIAKQIIEEIKNRM